MKKIQNDKPKATQTKLKLDNTNNSKEKNVTKQQKSKLKLDDKTTKDTPKIDITTSKPKSSRLKLDDKDKVNVVTTAKDVARVKQSRLKQDKNSSFTKDSKEIKVITPKRKSYQSVKLYKNYDTTINKLSNNRTTQKLYQKHLSNSLKLKSSNKIEKSTKIQLSQKSQVAIRLYHELNPDNSKTQLEKYNQDFNNRSYRYRYFRRNNNSQPKRSNFRLKLNRKNFSLKLYRKNYNNNSNRKNYKVNALRNNFKTTSKRENYKVNDEQITENTNYKAKHKRFIKKKYAQAFRDTMKKEEKAKENNASYEEMQNSSKKAFRLVTQTFMKIVKPLIIPFLLFVVVCVIICCASIFFMAIIQGPFASGVSSSYTADEEDILSVESEYVEMEEELRDIIANIETEYLDFDEYVYDIDAIGHDPHELASYLTALLIAYTPETAKPEIVRLFQLMYKLEFEEIEEERTVLELVVDSEGNPILDTEGNPQYTEVIKNVKILNVTLTTKPIVDIAKDVMTDDEYEIFELLLETKGNNEDVFSGGSSTTNISTMNVETNNSPSIVTSHHLITNSQFAETLSIGEQFIGQPYVWGGSSPSTGFDCSGFISYILNQSGVASFPRTTAQGLYNMSTKVPNGQQQAGDLVFFKGTYNTSNTVTHVGFYVGNGVMLHCGNPIGYVNINSSAYAKNFYAFGRIG